MNKLAQEKRIKILNLLVEGVSMRSICRVENVNYRTVEKLLLDAGKACRKFHNRHVRGIEGTRKIQCDELWSFVYNKDRSSEWAEPLDTGGSVWTWTAIDADSKLLVSYFVRKYRNSRSAIRLFKDIKKRHRETPMLFSDGLEAYAIAAEQVFPDKEVLTQVRHFEDSDHATSFVERHNLTIRMANRRYSRKTNAFSKRFAHHEATMDLFVTHYNWVRDHSTLCVPPAVEAGLISEILDMSFIAELIEANAKRPRKPGPKTGSRFRARSDK